jgi:hypothetical protein
MGTYHVASYFLSSASDSRLAFVGLTFLPLQCTLAYVSPEILYMQRLRLTEAAYYGERVHPFRGVHAIREQPAQPWEYQRDISQLRSVF